MPGSLLKVHTVCLDTSALTKPELGLLKRVVNRATKPQGVLSRLNWQLQDACDSVDAIVKLDMRDRDKESWDDAHAPASAGVGLGISTVTFDYGRASQDARYRPRLRQDALSSGRQAS